MFIQPLAELKYLVISRGERNFFVDIVSDYISLAGIMNWDILIPYLTSLEKRKQMNDGSSRREPIQFKVG